MVLPTGQPDPGSDVTETLPVLFWCGESTDKANKHKGVLILFQTGLELTILPSPLQRMPHETQLLPLFWL